MFKMIDFADFFLLEQSRHHKIYEILRAAFVEKIPLKDIALRFGYSYGTVRNITSEFRKHPDTASLFVPDVPSKVNPKETPTPNASSKTFRETRNQRILELRTKHGHSVNEIYEILQRDGIQSSVSNIGLILRTAGVKKLPRRPTTQQMDAVSVLRAAPADQRKLDLSPSQCTTKFAGLFLFAFDLARMNMDQLIKASHMPGSIPIPAGCAIRALLGLKLWGNRRTSHVMNDLLDPGMALFAGLNTMPKRSTLTEYSGRVHPESIAHLMSLWHPAVQSLGVSLGSGDSFDLDDHAIPYHGDDALMEKHYISKRSRSQKGILSLVVRDAEARYFVFANAKIRQTQRMDQIPLFLDFWKQQTGKIPRELVFDSTFANRKQLHELNQLGVQFITLRKRSQKMVKQLLETPSEPWKKVHLSNVGRAYRNPRVLESMVNLPNYKGNIRQLAIMDLGHATPTLMITNQMKTAPSKLIDRYARRMIIENTIANAIDFFHLDALTSAVPLKIDVDLQLTVMASTLYQILARRVGNGMENARPSTLFKRLVDNRGKVQILDQEIIVTLKRRCHCPYLLAADYQKMSQPIPWLNNKILRIEFQ